MKRNKVFAVLCGAMMLCTTALVSCEGSESDKDINSKKDRAQTNQSDYDLKTSLTKANSSASCLYDSINSVLIELDESGADVGAIKSISYNKGDATVTVLTGSVVDDTKIYRGIEEYFDDVNKLDFVASCDRGVCIAVACKEDDTYTGSKPTVVTTDNYKDYSDDLEKALADAVNKANVDR